MQTTLPEMSDTKWSYEWKAKTILGEERPGYFEDLKAAGWEEVPADEMPPPEPRGRFEPEPDLTGLVLMRRDARLTSKFHKRQHSRKALELALQGALLPLIAGAEEDGTTPFGHIHTGNAEVLLKRKGDLSDALD